MAFNDMFVLRREIQRSLLGRVYLVWRVDSDGDDGYRATKISKVIPGLEKAGIYESVVTEREVLTKLRDEYPHRNLLCLSPEDEQFVTPELYYITMPFASNGDLFTYFKTHQFSFANALVYSTQIMLGLRHLHEKVGYAHNDMSLENVLVFDDVVKISDYGLSMALGEPWPADRKKGGKMPYQAPEIYTGTQKRCARAADVFSLGCIVFMLVYQSPPFERPDPIDARFEAIQRGTLAGVLDGWGALEAAPASFAKLMERMLHANPEERVSLDSVMQDEIFKPIVHRYDPDRQ